MVAKELGDQMGPNYFTWVAIWSDRLVYRKVHGKLHAVGYSIDGHLYPLQQSEFYEGRKVESWTSMALSPSCYPISLMCHPLGPVCYLLSIPGDPLSPAFTLGTAYQITHWDNEESWPEHKAEGNEETRARVWKWHYHDERILSRGYIYIWSFRSIWVTLVWLGYRERKIRLMKVT